MIFGFLLLFVGLPASIITTIVFAVKKNKVEVAKYQNIFQRAARYYAALSIMLSFISIFFLKSVHFLKRNKTIYISFHSNVMVSACDFIISSISRSDFLCSIHSYCFILT